jgi:ubiquinone/menaquinone biosynthesis C-methylase UbiE
MNKIKKNVSQFNKDIGESGSYSYTTNKLSSTVANLRISEEISSIYDFNNKVVLDLGCGDGSYTLEFPSYGVSKVVGVDPAGEAIVSARKKSILYKLDSVVDFVEGNIYDLSEILCDYDFDCIVVRGVLHHLPDAELAIKELSKFTGDIIILEPNGNNPILKLIENFSSYHRLHEERSFSSRNLSKWITSNNMKIKKKYFFNLVPFFCPDWFVKILGRVEPIFESIPMIRAIACGQIIFLIESS